MELRYAVRPTKFDGPTNMALDSALLEASGLAWRVYEWDGPWVSLGRFQSADAVILPDAPVQWVERPTGGRAVLHGHDVTLGFAIDLATLCPAEQELARFSRSVRAVYRAAIAPVVEALRLCDLGAALGESAGPAGHVASARHAKPRKAMQSHAKLPSQDCFAAISPNDVIDLRTGHKICGCALRVTDTRVLVQCSIPAGPPIVEPARVYRDPAPVHFVPITAAQFAAAFESALVTLA